MDKYAVIVAAGSGSRMQSAIPKQFLLLNGKPVLWHTVQVFQKTFPGIHIVLVIAADYFMQAEEIRQSSLKPEQIQLVTGGDSRFQSVRNGLLKVVPDDAIVFVHDGVRCLVSRDLLLRCEAAVLKKGSAVPGIRSRDTVRMENAVVDRNNVWLIQTPQVFFSGELKKAFDQPYEESFTDESIVFEKAGYTIHIIEGEETNIKITRPVDLQVAEKLLNTPQLPL